MSTVPHPIQSEQLDLFQPPPLRPSWRTLPPEVRSRVLELLIQLWREPSQPLSATRKGDAVRRGKEAGHE